MAKAGIVTIFLISWLISVQTCFAYTNENPTLLFFTASWCKYCQVAKNDLNTDPKLSEIIKNYDVVVLDLEVDKDLVAGYNIKTIPAFIIFKDGKEHKRQTGYSGGSRGLYKFLK